jgi:predicted S18 family serine protease
VCCRTVAPPITSHNKNNKRARIQQQLSSASSHSKPNAKRRLIDSSAALESNQISNAPQRSLSDSVTSSAITQPDSLQVQLLQANQQSELKQLRLQQQLDHANYKLEQAENTIARLQSEVEKGSNCAVCSINRQIASNAEQVQRKCQQELQRQQANNNCQSCQQREANRNRKRNSSKKPNSQQTTSRAAAQPNVQAANTSAQPPSTQTRRPLVVVRNIHPDRKHRFSNANSN